MTILYDDYGATGFRNDRPLSAVSTATETHHRLKTTRKPFYPYLVCLAQSKKGEKYKIVFTLKHFGKVQGSRPYAQPTCLRTQYDGPIQKIAGYIEIHAFGALKNHNQYYINFQ